MPTPMFHETRAGSPVIGAGLMPGFLGFPQTSGPKRSLHAWESDFELPVRECLGKLLKFGMSGDVSVDVLMAAVADLVAETAARLDLIGDGFSLDSRMEVFCQRVEQTYARMKLELGAKSVVEVEGGA